jgi:hypothetical protein
MARCDGDEGGNVSAVVQTDVEFDGSLVLFKGRPGKEFQTEVDDAGVQGIELFLNRNGAWERRIDSDEGAFESER